MPQRDDKAVVAGLEILWTGVRWAQWGTMNGETNDGGEAKARNERQAMENRTDRRYRNHQTVPVFASRSTVCSASRSTTRIRLATTTHPVTSATCLRYAVAARTSPIANLRIALATTITPFVTPPRGQRTREP